MSKNIVSTGRGGSGNIGVNDPSKDKTAKDLETPSLKQDRFTTGRGGQGNMMLNLQGAPEMARAAQDVDVPPERHSDKMAPSSAAGISTGRGGGGNMYSLKREEAEEAAGERQGRAGNLVDSAKEMLNSLRGSSKQRKADEAAGGK